MSCQELSREPIQYDPSINGPVHNRSCTDTMWLIVFIFFLGVWGFVGYYGMKHGNIQKLLAPIDSNGQHCGLDAGLEDKKYMVFFNIVKCLSSGTPITSCPTPRVCVKQCPTRTILFDIEMNESNFANYRSSIVCTRSVTNFNTMTYAEAKQYIAEDKCASYVLQSEPVIGRCFVNVTEVVTKIEEISKGMGLTADQVILQTTNLVQFGQRSTQIVRDLVQSRCWLLGALVGVGIICFIYILLLRWVVAPVVWTSIAAFMCLLGFCIYLCYKNYAYYKANPVTPNQTNNREGYSGFNFSEAVTWLMLLIAVVVLLFIFLLIIIFLRKRILIAIALIQEGSKAVTAIKSTILFPIFPYILQCFVIAYGVLVFTYLLSIGELAFKDYQSCDPTTFSQMCDDTSEGSCRPTTCHSTGPDSPDSIVYLHLVNLLGFFWTMFFISGISDMMLASTFSTWYWTYHKRDLPFFTLSSGIWRTLRYHIGTVAFGSLILAIVWVTRVIARSIGHQGSIKRSRNPLSLCIICFCKCFCSWLENFIKFINKNAYIMCAIYGHSFCKSARDAFSLLMRNIVRVVVLNKVIEFLFFVSKLLISIGVGVAVFYLLQWKFVYEVTQGQSLHHNHIPAIILSIATYLICNIFFNVYVTAVDTLVLCFLEDCERNDGSPEKPYFMSKNLMKILEKRNE